MKKTKRILSLLLVMLCMAGLFGCGEADISEYGEDEIKIVGLLEEDFTITPNELSQLEIMEVKTTGNTKKAGTVKTYGPTLETFLAQYGKTLDEFYAIKFKAADDYKVTLGAITWNEHDVILSVANGSKARRSISSRFES